MPTTFRRWYISRLLKQLKDVNNIDSKNESVSENMRKVDEYISKL
jgi:hypothetical protein